MQIRADKDLAYNQYKVRLPFSAVFGAPEIGALNRGRTKSKKGFHTRAVGSMTFQYRFLLFLLTSVPVSTSFPLMNRD